MKKIIYIIASLVFWGAFLTICGLTEAGLGFGVTVLGIAACFGLLALDVHIINRMANDVED